MDDFRIKPFEELTISDDYMFKRVMSKKSLCQKMLERILDINIENIEYIEEEKVLQAHYDTKGIRLDVYAKDASGAVFNIEMQVRVLPDMTLFRRARYYQAQIDTDLLMKGVDYDALNPTFIIFICPFSLFNGTRHLWTFRNFCVEDKGFELEDGTTKIFLSTQGSMDDIPKRLRSFLEYVDGKTSDDSFVKELDNEIALLKSIDEERVGYMTFAAKMQEERKEAFKAGEKSGEMRQAERTAVDMLRDKVDIHFVAKYTHLSLARLKELAETL